MSVTFHRAFDVSRDPFEALETLISAGVDRVLTSGQQPDAEAGAELIAKLVEVAGDRIKILGCGGLTEHNISWLVNAMGVSEVHFTGFTEIESRMSYRNEKVFMGGSPPPSEYARTVTDADKVRTIIASI
jgi:copper homeostasis protein